MTTKELAPAPAPAQESQPQFHMTNCFLSNASVELPRGGRTHAMLGPSPNVDINVARRIEQLGLNQVQIALRATARGVRDGETLFVVEVEQSGVFTIANLPPEHEDMATNVETAFIVHPYLRASFHDLLVRAGLPPLMLPQINWAQVYQQEKEQAAKALEVAPANKALH